jgi:hypothetical protein
VTLAVQVPTAYYLSEGATGTFFDEDLLIGDSVGVFFKGGTNATALRLP